MKRLVAAIAALCGMAAAGSPAQAAEPVEIRVWHALSGPNEATFDSLVERFNAEHKDIKVVTERKGDEDQTLEAGLEAARTRQAPHLLQVPDDRSTQLIALKIDTRPIATIIGGNPSPDFKWFTAGASTFVKDAKGRLLAFPFTTSAPVFLYNKDAYRKVGLDPEQPPRTWRELQAHLLKLQPSFACPYATSREAWIHIENLGSIHHQPIATRNNGMDGPKAQLTFNDLLHVRHLALMRSWVTSELFRGQSRGEESDARFVRGECATLTTGSSALGLVQAEAKFAWGVAPLPTYDEETRDPGLPIVGGSSFWAMAGKRPAEYKAIAAFLAFLATPVVATEWHEKTGYLPLTEGAYAAARKAHYDAMPGMAAIMEKLAEARGRLPGIRLPRYSEVRDILDGELDAAWQGKKPPKQALDDAVRRGNAILKMAR